MNKIVASVILTLFILSSNINYALDPHAPFKHNFYVGIGTSFNTIDETFSSYLNVPLTEASAADHYNATQNRLAPLIQLGYWSPICDPWLWGLKASWHYLRYITPNVNSSRGQYLPNATFSSINFLGPNVIRDFTSITRLKSAYNAILYIGLVIGNGYAYLGFGPTLITGENNLYISSIHTPNGTGSHLTSGSNHNYRTLFGGVLQLGYNYYLTPDSFIDIFYSYEQTNRKSFNDTENAAILNGFNTVGPNNLLLNRSIRFTNQSISISINRLFSF